MSDEKKFQFVGFLQSETAAALTVDVLNERYPNVEFEGSEYGDGSYIIKVAPKYKQESIPQHTIDRFFSTMIDAHSMAVVIARKYDLTEKKIKGA